MDVKMNEYQELYRDSLAKAQLGSKEIISILNARAALAIEAVLLGPFTCLIEKGPTIAVGARTRTYKTIPDALRDACRNCQNYIDIVIPGCTTVDDTRGNYLDFVTGAYRITNVNTTGLVGPNLIHEIGKVIPGLVVTPSSGRASRLHLEVPLV